MQRRALLTALTGTMAASAGCSTILGPDEPSSLGDPAVTRPEDGVAFYNFDHDDARVVDPDVSVRERREADDLARVVVELTAADDWETSALQFGLRAPAELAAGELPAPVFLEVPDGMPYAGFTLRQTSEKYSVVETAGLHEKHLGTGTLSMELVVVPEHPVESLSIRAEMTARDADGKRLTASVTDHLSMPML